MNNKCYTCEERKKMWKSTPMNMCDVLYNCENSSWCLELSHIFFSYTPISYTLNIDIISNKKYRHNIYIQIKRFDKMYHETSKFENE